MSLARVDTTTPRTNGPIPTLQTPKPTQPYPNVKYQQLLNNTQELPSRPHTSLSSSSSTTRSSTNPSPSSTLCSHGLSGQDISKFFMDPSLVWNVAAPPSKLQLYVHPFAPPDFETQSEAGRSCVQSRSEPPAALATTDQPSYPPHNYEGRMLAGPPPRPLKTNPYKKLKKSWNPIFEAGCRTLGPIERAEHAKQLVGRGTWSDDAILDLVRAFIWRASDFEAPQPVNFVALFAAEVSAVLIEQQRPDERFKHVLREALINTMMGCWHVPRDDNGDPLPTEGHRPVMLDRNPTVDYKRHVRQAVALCGFVGCLYKQDQLPRIDVAQCVRVIFLNAKVVEHLHAIGAILTGAGTKLWAEAVDLKAETKSITTEIKKLKHKIMDAWVLYLPRGGTKEKIEQLVAFVENCAAKVLDERAVAQVQAGS
ncbi:hypothetical protein NLJ89_g1541 [Agrocybe chaxingu]|uniref:Uncharacterized protein n=1 Tax=Agrocybe chaxingu TaxID=84603 RepID=A0A9W8TD66_9AGAR|nr:hypothetical protein NLJ89_g1541 [Agrocybe chaxingu]